MRLGSQVAAALKQKKQLMDAVELMKLIQAVNFSSLMGIPDAELVSFGMKEGVVTKHKVTPYFCRRDSQGSHMSAGVVTALFDEISTMDVILQDRTHRPGVSVTLHVDMFDTAVASGTTLHLRSWAHKIGATLGFLAMRLENHSGTLVATGSHVKFLPSPFGRAWDLCFHPLVYPLLRTRLKTMVQPHVAKGEKVSIDHDHGSIYDHFPLHDLHLAPPSPHRMHTTHNHPPPQKQQKQRQREKSPRRPRCLCPLPQPPPRPLRSSRGTAMASSRYMSVSITYLAANPNGATVNLAAATPVDPRSGGPGGPVVSHVDVFGRGGKLTNQAVFVLREQLSTP